MITILILIVCSLFFLEKTKPIVSFPKYNFCMKPTENMITNALIYSSIPISYIDLSGFCNKKDYTYTTLDEQLLRKLKTYTNLAIEQLNQRCSLFGKETNSTPFHFVFIEIIKASSETDSKNSNWKVDVMVEESSLHISLRLIIEFIVEIETENSYLSCAEYTNFPFTKYFIGYPTYDQMIPLPTQVISTGPGIVLSQLKKNHPSNNLFLHKASIENSTLALKTKAHINSLDHFENSKYEMSNKWPRLYAEPTYQYPTPIKNVWNKIGLYPTKKDIRWSTEKAPLIPTYWPTFTGLNNEDNWLFNVTGGYNTKL